MKTALLVLLVFLAAGPVLAQDRLHLKSGQTVEGSLVSQDETSVQMEVAGIPLTYWMEDVEFLQKQDGTRVTPEAQGTEEAGPAEGGADWQTAEPEPAPASGVLAPPPPIPASFSAPPAAPQAKETFSAGEAASVLPEEETLVSGRTQGPPQQEEWASPEDVSAPQEGRLPSVPKLMSFGEDVPAVPPQLPFIVVGAGLFLFLLSYAYFAYCLQVVAQKTGIANGWFAWVPIMNIVLICDIAGRPRWWTALVFGAGVVPFIGVLASAVVFTILAWEMCLKRGKPGWLGILMVLPVVQFVAWGYLAFSE